MKLRLLLFPLMLVGLFAVTGCHDDEDHIQVTPQMNNAFNSMFPDASRVNWEREGRYYVAEFWRPEMNAEAEAWFDESSQWIMTITDITYAQLPDAIKTSFESSEYATWRVEDVDWVERADRESVYVLDVESGNQECELYYTADGVLVKTVNEGGSGSGSGSSDYLPGDISSSITDFITTHYPDARIIETDRDARGFEVDILDGGVHRELTFTEDGVWKYTKTEVRRAEVPDAITRAFEQSQYASYFVDEIDLYETPEEEFYLFELESNPEDIYLKISMDGTIEQLPGAIF